MKKFRTISIIIPVYNEEGHIEKALREVTKANSCRLKKEIIVVNDGSTDKTTAILKKLQEQYSVKKKKRYNLFVINKRKNEGKGSALKMGFRKSSGDIVLIQDADLEYNPRDYPILLNPFFKDAADVVYGSRFYSTQSHRVLFYWHYLVNIFLTNLSNMLTNLTLSDMETGYKVFKGDIIRKIAPKLESNRFGFEPEITARLSKIKNIRIFEVGISYSGRTYDEGKKINWKDGIKAIYEIVKYNIFR